MNKKSTTGIVIPTLNAGERVDKLLGNLAEQRDAFDKCLVIDSGSVDRTLDIAAKYGCDVAAVPPDEFNHGATRNLGLRRVDCDFVIFLTQDAIPEKNAISKLLRAFDNPLVAIAYGRQIPHDDADPIAAHARRFNYPADSYVYSMNASNVRGIKTVFASNSFAAYRSAIFRKVGGFPEKAVFGEDMYFTAKALLSGYCVAYVAEAMVKHSHNYSLGAQFRRSFDIGRFHRDESWIAAAFGRPESEGFRFVASEWQYLVEHKKYKWLPCALCNNIIKYVGYRLGKLRG